MKNPKEENLSYNYDTSSPTYSSASQKKSYRTSLKEEEKKVYKRLGIITTLTAVVLLIIFFLGIPFVNVLGNFWQFVRGGEKTIVTQNTAPVIKPRIEPIPLAVNTETLEIRGYSSSGVTVKATLNNSSLPQTQTESDGSFSFTSIKLKEGLNILVFVAVSSNGTESEDESVSVTYDKKPPKLDLSNPPDSTRYGANLKELNVTGTTESDAIVNINDFQAIVSKEGEFSFSLPLKGGANKIKVTAKDLAGNQTTIERTVHSDLPVESVSIATPSAAAN